MRPPVFKRINYNGNRKVMISNIHFFFGRKVMSVVLILRITLICLTSSKDSNMSILGWWMVQTIVLPVSATFFTARMTIAAALASKPVVGSSIKIIDGLATSSTPIVSRLRCSVDRPLTPGIPTKDSLIPSSSMVLRT